MHTRSMERWSHDHVFLGAAHERNERKTWLVIGLTAGMMVAEIVGGTIFGSMAVVADGFHMSTHAAALTIAAFAYMYARRHKHDTRFTFGTGKFGDLAAFTSAVVLALISVLILYEAGQRLLHPVPIAFGHAIAIALVSLSVNILSAWLLRADDNHDHAHDHAHVHHHHHDDNNLRAAFTHVLADAATALLAIIGLSAGWVFGWLWMDALMAMVGACVIANWSYSLIRASGRVLLDVTPDTGLADEIHRRIEDDDTRIADLHLWQVGPGHFGAIVSIVAHAPQPPTHYRARLADLALAHLTIETQICD